MTTKNKNSFSLLSLFLLAILVLSLVFGLKLIKNRQQAKVGAAPASTMFISPTNQSVKVGDDITFSVRIDTSENRITGVDIAANFDPTIYEVTSISRGENVDAFEHTILSNYDNTTGYLVFSAFTVDVNKAVTGSNIEVLKINAKVSNNINAIGTHSLRLDISSAASAVSESQNVITGRQDASFTVSPRNVDPTYTPTSAPGEPNSCGGTCGSNSNCKQGLFCHQGYCRNPQCQSDSDCSCNAATTTPTQRPVTNNNQGTATTRRTATPIATNLSTPVVTAMPVTEIIDENNNPVVVSYSPLPRAEEFGNTNPQNKLAQVFKVLVYVLGGVLILVLAYYLYLYLSSKNKRPTIVNPE